MTKWLSHRMVERGIIKREEQELYQFGIRNGMILASKRCDGTGHRSAHRATGGCGSVYPFFYGSSQLYRWISLRQRDFLLPWFQSGAAGSGLYTGCVFTRHRWQGCWQYCWCPRGSFFYSAPCTARTGNWIKRNKSILAEKQG